MARIHTVLAHMRQAASANNPQSFSSWTTFRDSLDASAAGLAQMLSASHAGFERDFDSSLGDSAAAADGIESGAMQRGTAGTTA